MFSQISYKPKGYQRKVTRTVIICDDCGRQLNWCTPHPQGQFCDDCLMKRRKQEKLLTANSRGK